ncbi:putative polyketide synthase [Mycena venus]|uniref:Putative polyketide synthase n=1 Tax=Mycena venus TaxID=2733690 RepID=A0A8H6WYU6_9AGAR|nr:putative polyketide synthase [Mycena venus]
MQEKTSEWCDKIAIVGISCELPSGHTSPQNLDHENFFQFLLNRGEAYEKIPSERFNAKAWFGTGPGQISVDTGAFLKDIDRFDNLEFGLSVTESRTMSPATRKLIENSFLALLDSGIDYRNRNVGCYMSANPGDLMTVSEPDEFDALGSFANYPAMVANKVSYILDLLGPSLPTDTACSSTATATHLAVQALRCRDCDAAVVGGCQLNHRFVDWITYSQGSLLAPNGKSKPFDASADGFARAEGCAVIVLKRLDTALKDNDHIYATIVSTAINSSGSRAPAGAPVAARQRDVMLEAFRQANRRPQDVDYLELHATGTAKGDPTEVNWVGEQFCRDRELIVGSVKGNIGHTEIVSFFASLSKVLSILHHRLIPPNVNFFTPNPAIEWEKYNIRVPTKPIALPCAPEKTPIIAMSSFGIGGANAHIVLEGPSAFTFPTTEILFQNHDGPLLLMAGGLTPRTAGATAEYLMDAFSTLPSDARGATAIMLGRRSKQMLWRTYAVVDALNSQTSFEFPPPNTGPQYGDMGRELFKIYPLFKRSVLEMDAIFTSVTQKSLIHDYGLFGRETAQLPDPWPISLILPSITVFQIALYELLLSLNVRPDIVVGHSAGETAVLYTSGASSKAMAVELSIIRGRVFSSIESADGAVAALSCSAEQATDLISAVLSSAPDLLADIACYNSPSDVAISGDKAALHSIIQLAAALESIFKLEDNLAFVEIAPHPVLSGYISTTLKQQFVYCPVRRPKSGNSPSEHADLLAFCGRLTANGHNCVDFTALNRYRSGPAIRLPPYPFLKKSFPLYPDTPAVAKQMASRHGPLNHDYLRINKITHPMLAEHVIRDEPIMAAAGFLEMALEFGASALMNVNFRSILALSSSNPMRVKVTLDGSYWCVRSSSSLSVSGANSLPVEKLHAEGYLSFEDSRKKSIIDIDAIRSRCSEHVNADFYDSLSYFSSYGPRFQRIMNASYGHGEALLSVKGSDSISSSEQYILHPAILDACLHILGYKPFHGDLSPDIYYLPAGVKTLLLHKPSTRDLFPPFIYAHFKLVSWSPNLMSFDIAVFDDTGNVLCSLNELQAARHRINPLRRISTPFDIRTQLVLHDQPQRTPAPINLCCESVDPGSIVAEALGHHLAFIQDRRVLRIFFNQQAVPLFQNVASIFADYDHYYEVHLPLLTDATLPEDLGIIRVMSVDFSAPPNQDNYFDILIIMDEDANPSVEHYLSFLSPTGISLLAVPRDTPRNVRPSSTEDNTEQIIQSPEWCCYTLRAKDGKSCLYDSHNSFTFDYTFGNETALQWGFSGLNVLQKLDVWILADHPAALGFSRAIRYEYSSWNIRLVLFPVSFPPALREDILRRLPHSLRREPEFLVSESGDVLVTRIMPFPRLSRHGQPSSTGEPNLYCTIQIGGVVGFIAKEGHLPNTPRSVENSPDTCMGLVVAGEAPQSVPVSESLVQHKTRAIQGLHSLVSAILALPNSIVSSTRRILLTHADTSYGHFISFFYSLQGHKVTKVETNIRLSQLAAFGQREFDLVVSGYGDREHTQILASLVRPLGRLFLWDDADNGLLKHLLFNPSTVRRAMEEAVNFLEDHITELYSPAPSPNLPLQFSDPSPSIPLLSSPLTFKEQSTYLILGGIGHIGAHIALYLYQHGARHITITSRSGRAGVLKTATIARRILTFLDQQSDLALQYETVDATSQAQMQAMIQRMAVPPRACFVLTSTLSDGTFAGLGTKDFTESFASKISVLDTLQRTVDIPALDFMVAFSSVSGTFGNAGQSAYDATNTAMEYIVATIPNAFSFICPGLSDSSMMLGAKQHDGHILSTLIPWAISTEEMILWLNDALTRYSHGERFCRYLPDTNWGDLDKFHGMSLVGRHLVPSVDFNATAIAENSETDTRIAMGRIIQQTLNIPTADFAGNVPLTAYGIDSLSSSRISFLLRPFVQISQIQLLADISLDDICEKMGEPTLASENRTTIQSTLAHRISLKDALRRWLHILEEACWTVPPSPAPVLDDRTSDLNTVMVTGTTGVLGAHILYELLLRDDVCCVYALNRGDRAGRSLRERQIWALSKYGLDGSLATSSKLVLVEGDLESENLGLDGELKKKIFATTTHIIHNAWNVNFGLPLADFDDLIQGTLNLLRLAALRKASFSFISTIGVYQGTQLSEPAAECAIEHFLTTPPSGYLQSKLIAERLVQIASDVLHLRTNVIRIGLLTGTASGFWHASHWLPTLVESGLHLGCLPDGEAVVSWLPVAVAARAIVDCQASDNSTLHIVHPHPTSWTSVISIVAEDLQLALVPYSEWLVRLQYMAKSAELFAEHHRFGALKLLDFYRMASQASDSAGMIESLGLLPVVAMGNALRASASLKEALPLGARDVQTWMSYWRSISLIPQKHSDI